MFDFLKENNLPAEVAADLIKLGNSLTNLPKTGIVEYETFQKAAGKYTKTNFNYVELDTIVSKIKENNDFFVSTSATIEEDKGCIYIQLLHKSGLLLSAPAFGFNVPAIKPQERKAQITYARRYALTAFFNIAADPDLDGADPDAAPKQSVSKEPVKIGQVVATYPKKETSAPENTQNAQVPQKKTTEEWIKEAENMEFDGKKLGTMTLDELSEITYLRRADEKVKKAAVFLVGQKQTKIKRNYGVL